MLFWLTYTLLHTCSQTRSEWRKSYSSLFLANRIWGEGSEKSRRSPGELHGHQRYWTGWEWHCHCDILLICTPMFPSWTDIAVQLQFANIMISCVPPYQVLIFLAKVILNTGANACILSYVEMNWGMDLTSAFIYAVFSSSFPFL